MFSHCKLCGSPTGAPDPCTVTITGLKLLSILEICFFKDLKLQAEDNFILKLVQLEELLFVRHSVFIIGNAGTGKTQASVTFLLLFLPPAYILFTVCSIHINSAC